MPNSRRRKFTVHDVNAGNRTSTSTGADCFQSTHHSISTSKGPYVMANKTILYNTSSVNMTEDVASSTVLTATRPNATVDKDVTASSSNIDLFNYMQTPEDVLESKMTSSAVKQIKHMNRERVEPRRERARQHRIKVRSPRRRMQHEIVRLEVVMTSTGCDAIQWAQETEAFNVTNISSVPATVDDRASERSLDDMCRICHGGESLSLELGPLISACNCRGTVGRVHVRCLERWLTESGKSRCELCGARYATQRVHRYGVPRALLMWVLSQNAKQLMVDSLGIILMSPLAVLAAWLSGRTLAGLMTQEGHVTPWPLASTFVLACMTLVCYYCWIVSAATRHALGWWIWYRSQYEVRLLLQDTEES